MFCTLNAAVLGAAMLLQAAPAARVPLPVPAAPSQASPDDVIPAAPQVEPLPPVRPGARVLQSAPTQPAAGHDSTDAKLVIDRSALTITAWDMELLLRPAAAALAVRAHVTVRNDAAAARAAVPLQISSTLRWQAVAARGAKLAFTTHALDTDLDHTSAASEALITLPEPLAAGASTTLDVLYEGTIAADGTRIEHLGAPRDVAQQTDWDRIAPDFTGLRGFGTVLWFPVIADPVTLGDGAKIFHVIGEWKRREQAATMRLRVRVDSSAVGSVDADAPVAVAKRDAPAVAILNGERVTLEPGALSDAGGVVEGELPATPLGFAVPSIFLPSVNEVPAPGLRMFPRPEDANASAGFVTAMEQVRPLVSQWLGAQKRDVVLVDPPTLRDSPFETQGFATASHGTSVLVTPMLAQNPQQNTLAMAHALAHATFVSPRAWLSEGVAQFLTSLWIGNAQPGRAGDPAAALAALEEQRPALALAETSDPGADAGEPLQSATDDIYLRAKSAYVLWMLREIAGDEALTHALQAYSAKADVEPQYFQRLLETACHKDLQWFFDDWVYRDRGLADVRIVNVVSHKMDTAAPSWLVSVDIANQGYAAVEVPVTMRAGDASEVQRVRIAGRGSVTVRAILHAQPTSVTVNDGATPEINASVHETKL